MQLRNRGGHDARDYVAYVTFGEAMQVQSSPGSCSVTSNPPPLPEWQLPVGIPASATVYECTPPVIRPNRTRRLNFDVVKNPNATDDDLTFRADVTGEITLSDTTRLWFPTPQARGDGIVPRANDYTVDALRARVVGYNLLKDQVGVCTENNPPPNSPDNEIQIGEECEFSIESGGWFGFETPGYDYIEIEDVQVVDGLPDGQGYISSTDPFAPGFSTGQILGVSLNPPPAPLDEGSFDWTHNQSDRITVKDHWFRANATTRLLNDPVDVSASPNQHANISRNILTSSFDAVFFNPLTSEEETYTFGTSTTGYPPEFRRRVDLTVTEPNLIVTKEVCNETDYGFGPSCSNFLPLVDDGDAFDTYIFRVTVTNEAAAGGVPRAPAYDVTVFSDMDPSDLSTSIRSMPTASTTTATARSTRPAARADRPDNVHRLAATPAQIITAFDHSDALLRIDAGSSVTFYYRVDPDNQRRAAAAAGRDGLRDLRQPRERCGQPDRAPGRERRDRRGAPVHVGDGAGHDPDHPGRGAAEDHPADSRTRRSRARAPQPVSIGEEVEFELRTLIPVARLRSFRY